MNPSLATGLGLLLAITGCSDDGASNGGAGGDPPPAVCATPAAEAVTTDTSGAALASQIRQYTPSDEEVQLLAADISYRVVAHETGVVSPWYVRLDLATYLSDQRRLRYPSLYGACTTSSKLTIAYIPPESDLHLLTGTSSNCAPPASALIDCIDGAIEIAVGELLKLIPLAKFQQWVGSMDDAVAKAHQLTPELVPAVKSAVPPLQESKDILDILGRSIAQAQLVAGAAALVGLPSEAALPVLAFAGTAVSALKCARALSTAKRIVDACIAEEDKNAPSPSPSPSGGGVGSSPFCLNADGPGVVSQCDSSPYPYEVSCDDGSVPSDCEKSTGYSANGGILCCRARALR